MDRKNQGDRLGRCSLASLRRAVFAALVLTTVGAPAGAEGRALVVGIDDYSEGAGRAPLAGAVADARRFRDLLTGSWSFSPSQVTLLENEAATSGAILDALTSELLGQTRPGDRAVFYFAGLGTTIDRGGARGALPAIVAHDTESLLGRIPGDMFADLLDLMPDRRVTVVIDASFAGAPPEADGDLRSRGVVTATGPVATGRALFGQGLVPRDVWNAAVPYHVAWEAGGAGVFTDAFASGMSGAADANADGEVSNPELLAFVAGRTGAWCRASPTCASTGRDFTPGFADGPKPANPPAPAAVTSPPGFGELVNLASESLGSTNPAALQLSLEGPKPLRIGDSAILRIRAARPGQVLLLDLHGASGLDVLGAAPMPAESGEASLSLSFRAAEPVGPGALIGILLEAVPPVADEVLPDVPATEPSRFLGALSETLRRLNKEGGVAWSAALLSYEVAP